MKYSIDCNPYGRRILEGDSVLTLIQEGRVFRIEALPDGRFLIEEGGDYCFRATLTADQLFDLGTELQRMAAGEREMIEAFMIGRCR